MGIDSSNGEACSARTSDLHTEVERLIARHTESMRERIEKLEQHIETLEETRSLLGGGEEGVAVDNQNVHAAKEIKCGDFPIPNGGDIYELENTGLGGGMSRRISSRFTFIDSLPLIGNDRYPLPESTYTLLITEKIVSIGFASGIVAVVLAQTCLVIAFLNEMDEGRPGNLLGLPANVPVEVRVAQYLMLLIGVLMEQEIPTGLEIIGKGMEQVLSGERVLCMRRILLSSLLRLCLGYMFLLTLFVAVAQSENVLDMFFDVLALEFVENIDDVIFMLSKRGFCGRKLRTATKSCFIETGRETYRLRRWTKRLIRIMYIINICISLGALTYFCITQQRGQYRCKNVTISFGDQMWEDAYVGDGNVMEKRLLIFSHFNGVYEEQRDGFHDGRPKYVERNKVDGAPFKEVTPAEIVYCEAIESWVFRHEGIITGNGSGTENENDCSWLLKSHRTESFNLVELAEESEWYIWAGRVTSEVPISIECNHCQEDMKESCNYHGECCNMLCECFDGFYGPHCEFSRPCNEIRSEKDQNTTLTLLRHNSDFDAVYGRPIYVSKKMTGKPMSLLRTGTEIETGPDGLREEFFTDDFFLYNSQSAQFQELLMNYTFVLRYTGRRWYGDLLQPKLKYYHSGQYEEDYHAFWDNAFSGIGIADNSTMLISAPTVDLTPVGIDFFEMRRRNVPFGETHYDYGPMGVLIPLVENEGSGFFHCSY